MMEIKDLLRK
jgi:hypothetical protein